MALMGDKRGDTYFNQFFSKDDIEQMMENIKDDFAIEMGCSFAKKAEVLEKKLHEEVEKNERLNRVFNEAWCEYLDECE